MTAIRTFENMKKLLKKHNQSHLLTFWEHLGEAERQNLLAQIRQLDLPKIDDWITNFVKKSVSTGIRRDLIPAQSYSPAPTEPEQKRKYGKAIIFAYEDHR